MKIYGLDPGTEKSALVEWDGERVSERIYAPNIEIMQYLTTYPRNELVVERITSYGMAIGQETIDTAVWIGRFMQAYPKTVILMPRADVKLHLCGTLRSNDTAVRYAILERFGGKDKAIGKRALPGPLFGITSHLWQALAVAITYVDTNK